MKSIYIVKRGSFILHKQLRQSQHEIDKITKLLGKSKRNEQGDLIEQNILASKLTEIKDFPYSFQLGIFEKYSLLGEEDLDKQAYSATLSCYTLTGTVFEIEKQFLKDLMKHKHTRSNLETRIS